MTQYSTHLLNALPSAVLVVGQNGVISFLNPAAETMLSLSFAQADGRQLAELPGFGDEWMNLAERALSADEEITLAEYQLHIPLQPTQLGTLHVIPLESGQVMLTFEKAAGISRLSASAWKQESTRAAGVMAAMLAHEVKNPLSGIRGAAQLLREELDANHQPLADLICMESDRIRDLLNQVEIFSGDTLPEKQPVNIHEALQYVISVARAGFAGHVKFIEKYDPSLPDVASNRDWLVQLFLNLIKNAAEAMDGQLDATITLHTQYRTGTRIQHDQVPLPIAVSIEDNGPGIPATIRPHIFEPLISSKEAGRGLGLAVVAKLAVDIGAMVELDEERAEGTKFTVMLPRSA